ncbi:MAG: ATPase [Planctomycetes bacterium]|nr:ATPase [Planctomycetota bacterium]NOG53706.1 ATPase [Planctomycetota bacterium]
MSDQGFYVGVDAGSSATKCAVIDWHGNLVGCSAVPSGFDYAVASERCLEEALGEAVITWDAVEGSISTGYGREHVKFAGRYLTEITCHARGARQWNPDIRTIVDIGGQDTKVIRINDHGQLVDYRMNAKCAAGTGTFLESIALKLGMSLTALDSLAMESTAKTTINSYCTVFASTEVLERIKAGDPAPDIAMGLFRSIASRTFEMMTSPGQGRVAGTGGVVAYCRSMVRALGELLQDEVIIPPAPQFAGAYGAALEAKERGCGIRAREGAESC